MCNFFQKSESSTYRWKRFGYPYPVPVWKQFLDIRIRLQTHYPSGYPTGKPDSAHLCWHLWLGHNFAEVWNFTLHGRSSSTTRSALHLCFRWCWAAYVATKTLHIVFCTGTNFWNHHYRWNARYSQSPTQCYTVVICDNAGQKTRLNSIKSILFDNNKRYHKNFNRSLQNLISSCRALKVGTGSCSSSKPKILTPALAPNWNPYATRTPFQHSCCTTEPD